MSDEKKSTYKGQTDARRKATAKYLRESVEDIRIRVPKGNKAKVQEHAAGMGESTNAFVVRAITETMERDNASHTQPAAISSKEKAVSVQKGMSPSQPADAGRYKKLTEAAIRRIDLPELSRNIRYQLDIADTYGQEALALLLERARQKDASASPSGT